jgi:hypothetical protein
MSPNTAASDTRSQTAGAWIVVTMLAALLILL